jgi:Flp pilus assembly protein TadG
MSMTLRCGKGAPIFMKQSISRLLRNTGGSSLIEMALVMPVLLLLLVGAVDFGRAYYVAIEVNSAAHSAALYGSQNPTDTIGMVNAANLDVTDVPSLVTTPTSSCECYDGSTCGTSTSSPCADGNAVYKVQVKTAATYIPILSYPGIPSSIPLSSQVTMRAAY